tara:strand:- start:311 stop:556 length:246 start_codon:yes stop_codon:yes gene_type:complete
MSKPINDLGAFLHAQSKKSNEELAESIRVSKKLSNRHNNVVIFQEKRSLCSTAKKLFQSIKDFDNSAELIIKTDSGIWKQN